VIDAAAGQGLACAHAPLDLPGPCILLPSIVLPADKTSLAKEMLEERKRRKGNANRDMPRTPVLTLERQVELATLALTHVGKFRANQPTVKSTAVSKEGEHATTATSAYVQKDEGSTGPTTAAVNAQASGAAGGAKGKPSDAKVSDKAKDCPPKDASDERETRETRLLDKLRCIERVLPPLVARTAYLSESPISEGRDAMRQHLWLEIERYRQCACFTGTKVQILTLRASSFNMLLRRAAGSISEMTHVLLGCLRSGTQFTCFILAQKYEY